MHKCFNPHEPYFAGVAIAMIIVGSGVFALAAVEFLFNVLAAYGFANVFVKGAAGLVIIALGYIHMELELIRISRK